MGFLKNAFSMVIAGEVINEIDSHRLGHPQHYSMKADEFNQFAGIVQTIASQFSNLSRK
jgi:hypothetical protein